MHGGGLTFNAGECSGGGRDWGWTRVVTDADGHGWGPVMDMDALEC